MEKVFWFIFEIAVSVYETFNLHYFVLSFVEYSFKPLSHKVTYTIGALIQVLMVLCLNSIMLYEGAWVLLHIAYVFIYVSVFARKHIGRTLFAVLISYAWVTLINAFVTTFISAVASTDITAILSEQNIVRFVTLLCVQLIQTYVYRITLRLFRKNGIKLQLNEWLLILSVFVLSIFITIMIHIVQMNCIIGIQYRSLLMFSVLGIVVINIVCYYIVVRLSKANAIKIEHELLVIESDYRKHYAEDVKNQYNEIRSIRHDIKQSYQVIRSFVVEKKYDELEDYLPQMSDYINSIEFTVMTDHAVIDAILNTKLNAAKKQGIRVQCSVLRKVRSKRIEMIDLCHLLGNMLDNAIESAVQCEDIAEKYIDVSITEKKKTLLITVKNSYDEEKLQPEMTTSKADKSNHGFGLKTIRRIAKKYDGIADFYIENDLFCCTVNLRM